jgi:two-component system sensor histidine kinase NreB
LFRVTRELLTNVVKHAQATKVKVSIRRSRGLLHVIVNDNGVGFKDASESTDIPESARFGLFSVREQLEYIGGRLEIGSESGRGTTVTIIVPMRKKVTI